MVWGNSTIHLGCFSEVLCSPTKLCGKGNKRKQDDIDDDEEQQTWVEALSQELEDEEPSVDPDYEVGSPVMVSFE